MKLRDKIAIKAMCKIIKKLNPDKIKEFNGNISLHRIISKEAYKYADSMMLERQNNGST